MHRIIHTFKKILQLLFNRIFYVAVALMLQLTWLLITAWRLAAYSKYISHVISMISILVVLWIVNKKINPSYKLGWTILILCLPVLGVMLYILLVNPELHRQSRINMHRFRRKAFPI